MEKALTSSAGRQQREDGNVPTSTAARVLSLPSAHARTAASEVFLCVFLAGLKTSVYSAINQPRGKSSPLVDCFDLAGRQPPGGYGTSTRGRMAGRVAR